MPKYIVARDNKKNFYVKRNRGNPVPTGWLPVNAKTKKHAVQMGKFLFEQADQAALKAKGSTISRTTNAVTKDE